MSLIDAKSPMTLEMERRTAEPTVAVAFGGGGARGLAHIHVVEVLDELDIRPVAISGASIGAIIGSAMASGMMGREIREFALATVGNWSEVASRLWKLRPQTMKEVFSRRSQFGRFDVERILHGFLPEAIPENFEDLQIPTKIILTDYYAQCERVCDSGDLYNAIGASAAIPAVFRPVLRDGRVVIDGGIYNPVPYDHLLGLADIVIGIDVVGGPCGNPSKIPSRIDAIFGANQLMMQSIITMKLKNAPPDIFLRPDVGRFRVMDFPRAADILEASSPIREELKCALDAAFARHRRQQEGSRGSDRED
ncbi:patatin-like phospholipase family protein [Pararhizobium haloflavum]|uniref:patatin-like phospholipase family protein n=1 Tax=Pararhizobium haloflavum TaxID=2037914 RepID=UPI001FE06DBE|nr:patatin-like phospholipase family protein [Pararhizobium haloflavum]